MINFLIGLFVGANVAIVLFSLIFAGKRANS